MRGTTRWLLCVSWCLMAAVGWAQEGGTIRGTVYVSGNEPLPEAQVGVVGTELTATTNAEGQFELRNVPPARHELKVSFPGYQDLLQPVDVVAGQVASLELDLRLDEQFGEEIVVTGSKFGEKRLESPVTVESVQAKAIQMSGGTSYLTALSAVKGVDFADTGVNEKRISTRGFNTQFNSRMITMVDGRLAQMPGNGLPLGSQMPTSNLDLKSVEVVVGPASALYGANAHAGVINLITKSPWDESGATVALRGGTQSLVDASARVAGTVSEDFGYKVTGQFVRGEDFVPDRELRTHYYGGGTQPLVFEADMLEDYDVRSIKAEGFVYYRRGDWNFKGGYGFSSADGMSLTNSGRNHLRDWQVHQQTVSASHPNWFAQVSRTTSNAGGTYQLDRLAGLVQAGGGAPSEPSELDATREQIKFIDESQLIDSELQHQNSIGGLKLITGLQLRLYMPSSRGSYLADTDGKKLNATEFGGYLQGDYSLLRDKLRLVAAARLDTHSNYSAQFSPKAAVVYSPQRNHHLRAGYNRAFKSPTILENYLLINNTLLGNRTGFIIRDAEGNLVSEIDPLVPESVDSVEVGYKATFAEKLLVDVVAYHSWYENFISALTPRANPATGTFAFYPDGRPVAEGTPGQGALSTYANFGRSRVAGADLGLDYMLTPQISLNGSISYIKLLKFHSNDPSQPSLLLNVPDLKLKASITLQNLLVKNTFLRVFGRYQTAFEFRSGRWNSTLFYADGKVPARFVADIGAGYNFDNGLALSANVFNVFNDRGVDVLGAPPGGVMASMQLAYKYDGLNY
ncbi:TonB-dependent receptor [Hyalangium rubrum]|uniref:TonB-dependent receptor n=1 Tax=Hyalangium rubrum TaxID=3103134 RepID=A0ABU5H757_9BACT|nr:TonB-dependent receptor [Hyalangium sp. s54d21]MDY7229307.1 TonB-dependent receptor [Hyalangium sp. s54d21]